MAIRLILVSPVFATFVIFCNQYFAAAANSPARDPAAGPQAPLYLAADFLKNQNYLPLAPGGAVVL